MKYSQRSKKESPPRTVDQTQTSQPSFLLLSSIVKHSRLLVELSDSQAVGLYGRLEQPGFGKSALLVEDIRSVE